MGDMKLYLYAHDYTYFRAPPSNVTIIRITASKPQLSITPTTQCSSKVWIECESNPKRNNKNELEVNIPIENESDADVGMLQHKEIQVSLRCG